jgi:hypothetical protein
MPRAPGQAPHLPAPDGFDQTFRRLHGSGQAPHRCAFTLGRGARQAGRRMPGARPISDAAARTWAENEERKRAAVRDGPEKENVKVGFVGGKAGEKDDTRNLRVDSLIRFSFGPRTTGSGSARVFKSVWLSISPLSGPTTLQIHRKQEFSPPIPSLRAQFFGFDASIAEC